MKLVEKQIIQKKDISEKPRQIFPYGEVLRETITKAAEAVTIRRYRPSDADEVLRLNKKSLESIPGYGYSQRKEFGLLDRDILDIEGYYMKGRNDFIVAEIGGKIVGCASLRERKDKGENVVEFLRLRVDPDHFRKGIARDIYHVCYDIARKHGYSKAYASTTTKQGKSMRFHASEDWVYTGTYDSAWTDSFNATNVCYEKNLLTRIDVKLPPAGEVAYFPNAA